MNRGISILVCAGLAISGLLRPGHSLAAQEPQGPVALAEALHLFGQNSPDLQLARSRQRSAIGEARQARAIANPSLSATHEALGDYSESYLNLSQPVDFLWERSDRNARAEALVVRARGVFQADSLRLALEVKGAYLDAWRRGEIVATYRQALTVLEGLEASAETRFEEGDLAGYDLRRLRLERLQIGRRLAAAELDLADAEHRLGALVLELDDVRPLAAQDPGPMEASLPPRDHLVHRAWASRPEILAAESMAEAARADAGLARSSVFRGTTVTGGFKRQADGMEGAFLGIAVPLPVADRRRGAVDAAQADASAAEWELDLVRRSISRQVLLAAARLESALGQARLLGPAGGEEALELLDIARLSFQEGDTRAVDLLDATGAFIDARMLAGELRGDLWSAYFELEQAVGGPLNDGDESPAGENER